MQTPSGFTRHTKHKLTRRLVFFVALILLSISAILIAAILKARSDALAKARLAASFLSAALAEDVEGGLNTLACASVLIRRRLEKEDDSGSLPQLRQEISRYAPGLTAISIIGPDGRLRASSGNEAPGSLDFSDYDFFRASRNSVHEDFQVGTPVAIAKRLIIPAASRLDTKDGQFAGAVLFSIDPELAASLYRRVQLGDTGSIKVADTSGITFAGYTLPRGYDPSQIGTSALADRAFTHWRRASSGSYIATSAADGIERVYYWRKVAGFPFVAVVGLGTAEAMRGANRQALLIASLGMLSGGLLFATAAMVKRELSRRVKQVIALDRHRRKLREVNVKLTAAKQQAEEANRSKSIFLANMSHELRTPLNAILGFAEIIRDQIFGDDPKRYARYAADIYNSGAHLLNVIRNLLDISKIEAAKFELHETLVELAGIERESLRIVEGKAKSRGVALSATPAASGIVLCADETALKQILINLLSNAIKFTPEGGSVILSARLEADGCLTLTVTDTGSGMSPEEIKQALEPYRQVRSGGASSHPEGAGLGLPLTAQLTELHGGSLTVESTPRRGTSVSVKFPAWRVRLDKHSQSLTSLPLQPDS